MEANTIVFCIVKKRKPWRPNNMFYKTPVGALFWAAQRKLGVTE